MSPLPQRKKSAEEIAKLREELGISGEAPPPPDLKNETPPAPPPPPKKAAAEEEAAAAPPQPEEPPETSAPDPLPESAAAETIPIPLPKPVRSLKKSERLPVEPRPRAQEASTAGKIPVKRRSDQDLNEIRRREALAMQTQPPLFAPLLAHPALLAAGYLLAIGGGIFAWQEFHFAWVVASEAVALAVAGFVFFRKTLSRHHAGFIAILAVFIMIFAVLHYFPQLQNAS